jgi:hypothetical protein
MSVDQVLLQRLEALDTLRSESDAKQANQHDIPGGNTDSMDENTDNCQISSADGQSNNKQNDIKDVRIKFIMESVQLITNLEESLLDLIKDRGVYSFILGCIYLSINKNYPKFLT